MNGIFSTFKLMFSRKYSFFLVLLFCISAGNAAPIILYDGNGTEAPLMDASTRTWPEPPEYYANWDSMDGMEPPYIRLSGQASDTKDWTGAFTFANLPAKVSGGSLQIQIRATNNASISIWLETSEGNSNPKTYSLASNQTSNLDIAISDFGVAMPSTVNKIYVKMNQIPAYQYTTVFFDRIILSDIESSYSSSGMLSSSSSSRGSAFASANAKTFDAYLIAADTVAISDYTKTLGGGIYGNTLEIGADAKIYGSVAVGTKCFLRERSSISDTLVSPIPCNKQNGIAVGKEINKKNEYSHSEIEFFSSGSQDKFVAIGTDERLQPGAYGSLRIDARSTVRLQSGSYAFSSIHTEPDVNWIFDLSNGPARIYVLDGIRFADRNVFSIIGGNPSEIEWNVAGGYIDIGTDGKFFGRFKAPSSRVRISTRSHLVGGMEARHFQMEPQSTVSMEPRAEEISHSEYNFGPFYDKNLFRYRSALPLSANFLEMYIYAQGFDVEVNGNENRTVNLEKASQTVSVRITRPFAADFPSETFSSTYNFAFNKTSNNRIYWNPSSPCVSNCYGYSAETALRSFSLALAEAQKEGLEVKMAGGVYEVPTEHSVFPVGLELVGTEKPFWELESFSEIPVLSVKNQAIEIAGKSPRRFTGLHITGGKKGALSASTEKLELLNVAFTNNESSGNGGALRYGGGGLFIGKTLLLENSKGNKGGAAFIDGNADIENLVCSGNSARREGGCLSVQGNLKIANAVFHGNKSGREGGAFYAKNASVWNATVVGNESGGGNALSGNSGNVYNSIFWKNSGGDIPSSWAAEYSSFASRRNGAGNITGDPKFMDEKNAAGTAHFFGYDAGFVLADMSPVLKGSKVDGVLERDLLGTERGNAVAMGAYGDYNDEDGDFQYGEWAYGKFEPRQDMPLPLFPNFPEQDIDLIEYVGYGGYGRMIKHFVRKHRKTEIPKAKVRITVLDSNFKAYPDIKPVDVIFYRTSEENKKYVFETLIYEPLHPEYDPDKHGRLMLFSQDPEDQGIHGNFLIIHVKKVSDTFRYEVVEW